MNINDALKSVININHEIKKVLKQTEYDQYEDLSGLTYEDNAEHGFLRDELRDICNRLDEVRRIINYLNRDIEKQGILTLNQNGRYEILGTNKEYTCGSTIEFLYRDEFDGCSKWCCSRIEATGGRYYIVGHNTLELEGLDVRVRSQQGLYEY